jgi:hypothetical protein
VRSGKGAALVLAGVTVVYLLILGQIAWGLIGTGETVGILLGAAILVFPFVGAWLLWRELSFGFRAQRLQDTWRSEGREVPGSEPADFDACREQVESEPDDWHNWFRLGLAYAVSGDKGRARSAMRHADFLFRRGESA